MGFSSFIGPSDLTSGTVPLFPDLEVGAMIVESLGFGIGAPLGSTADEAGRPGLSAPAEMCSAVDLCSAVDFAASTLARC